MKVFLTSALLLCIFCQSNATAQHKDCTDCITWHANRKLTWADFKGKPQPASDKVALTDSGMSIALKCDNTTAEVVVKCFFNRSRSWTKDTESEYLLAHEQLHFDITELFVRKLRKQLSVFKDDCEQLAKHVQSYYDENYKEYVAYQDAYDKQTHHSLNKEKQAYWEQKVARELKKLKPYASGVEN